METFHHCQGHPNILQLLEFFEDEEKFYLVFEKINGGPLLTRIQENICFSEHDAAQIIKEIASGLDFLHKKGIAHRDLKVRLKCHRKFSPLNSPKMFFNRIFRSLERERDVNCYFLNQLILIFLCTANLLKNNFFDVIQTL